MKLLQSQYQDVLQALDEFQINHDRLSLTKKKGRINVHIDGIDSSFEFFKRKSVSLSEDANAWEKSEHFELKAGGTAALVADWKEVVAHLKRWLQSLN